MSETNNSSKRKRLMILAVVILLIVLLPLTVLTVYVHGYHGIFPNVYVGDMDLSGKSEAEALALLNQTYTTEKINGLSFSLTCEDLKEELTTDALGVSFLNPETASAAMAVGDSKNPVVRAMVFAKQLVQKAEIMPVIAYNSDLLHATIDAVAAPYEVEPVGYTFEIAPDTVTIHAPVAGVKVDRDAVTAEILRRLSNFSVSDMVITPVTSQPEPLDFEEFYQWLTSPAENACYIRDEEGVVTVQREKLQCSAEKDVIRDAVNSIEQSGNSSASFRVTTVEPEVLSVHLKENLYKDLLGTYTTYYSGTAARNNNVWLATNRVNGYELMPGEEFSYDQTILPRTAANGYQAAPVYVGNKVESGMGGGICQPSSTLYCAALYANLEIVERHNHSMLVSYLPAGLDATISQGALDLRLKNNTPYPVKISGQASGGVLTFSIWGYNPENISVDVLRGGGGYHYTATRIVKKDGVEIGREQLGSSRYVPPAPPEEEEATEDTPPEEAGAEEGTSPEESGAEEGSQEGNLPPKEDTVPQPEPTEPKPTEPDTPTDDPAASTAPAPTTTVPPAATTSQPITE